MYLKTSVILRRVWEGVVLAFGVDTRNLRWQHLESMAIVAGRMIEVRRKISPWLAVSLLTALGFGCVLPSGALAAEAPIRTRKEKKAAAAAAAATPEMAPPVPTPTPTPAVEVTPLTAEQMASSVTLDAMTVPTPGELFAALNKQCKPNWTAQYRGPVGTAYRDRLQAALNMGGLIADGYIAVEAADGQQVKNLGRDILSLAKTLGISKDILGRGASIQKFADDSDWSSLKEELEALQNEVKQEMEQLHDDELITLLSLGAWIRGTEAVSDVVLKNFSQQTSCILRQPTLVGYLRTKLDKLSPKAKDSPLIKSVDAGLEGMSKLVSFPLGETASKDDVQKLHDQASDLMKTIAKKEN